VLFRVLGPVQIRGIESELHLRLLTVLLARANTWVDVDTVVAALWPHDPQGRARGNVRTQVHHVRQLLPRAVDGSPRINSSPDAYRLNVAGSELDASVFEDLVRLGQTADDPAAAVTWFREALLLWRGEPYGPELRPFTDAETARLLALRSAARSGLAGALQQRPTADDTQRLALPPEPTAAGTQRVAMPAVPPEPDAADGTQRISSPPVPPESDADGTQRVAMPVVPPGRPTAIDDTQRIPPVAGSSTGPAGTAAGTADEAGSDGGPPWEPGGPPREPYRGVTGNEPPWAEWRVEPAHRSRRPVVLAALAAVVLLGVVVPFAVLGGWPFGGWSLGASTPTQPTASSTATPSSPTAQQSQPPAVSPRRAVPGMPTPGGRPRLLFGVGDRADTASQSTLVSGAGANVLSTRYGGPQDLDGLAAWRDTVVPAAYADGFALHLVVADDSEYADLDTEFGPGCGRPYPLSDRFLDDATRLAETFAGGPDSPPLFVSVFEGVETTGCGGAGMLVDEPTTAYYRALLDRYVEVREIFHRLAPNALVSLGWRSAQATYDEPAIGGGLSMFEHVADTMRLSDFVTVSMDGDADNVQDLQTAVKALGRYAPVLVTYYGSARFAERDLRVMLTDTFLGEATAAGVFAWIFDTDAALAASSEAHHLVTDAITHYGRSPT